MELRALKRQNLMSTAEMRAYQQLCDARGRVLVLAIDQRNAMRSLLADSDEARARISDADLGDVKTDLVRYLGNHAPAVLLDPQCALPGVIDQRILARDVALVVGMDASGWEIDAKTSLRQSHLISGIDARRVRKLGGTAAKLLVYMRPDREGLDGYAAGLIRQTTTSFAEEDLLLVVEILVYKLPDETAKDYEIRKPGLIVEAARVAAESGAKVLKLQFPGSEEACLAVAEALNGIPWAVLSEGADHETFLEQLRTAMKNGAAGAIAGRAIWKDCVSMDPNVRRTKMEELGVPRLRQVQSILDTFH